MRVLLPLALTLVSHAALPAQIAQQVYLKASNADPRDQFGGAVAVSGDTLVVSAAQEHSAAGGVNGDQFDNSAPGAGAVYVFAKSGPQWRQQAYLKHPSPSREGLFGYAVAISGDTLVVGAPRSGGTSPPGEAFVFVRRGTTWTQQAQLQTAAPSAYGDFGWSVAISGETIVIGERGTRAETAQVFVRSGTTWSRQAVLRDANRAGRFEFFGTSVAIDGDRIAVGAILKNNVGGVIVFERFSTTWRQTQTLVQGSSGDRFGGSVALAGDTLAIGAAGHGASWSQDEGRAYVYTRVSGAFRLATTLRASNADANDRFGTAVALGKDQAVVVGAPFERSAAKGIQGDQANNRMQSAGAAYLFRRNGNRWQQTAYLKASNTDFEDQFGGAVAAFGDTLLIGSRLEDSNARRPYGGQANGWRSNDSGSAYAFRIDCAAPCATAIESGTRCSYRDLALGIAATPPELGKTATVVLSGGIPNAAALVLIGLPGTPTPIGFAGCALHVDLGSPTLTIPVTLDALGSWELTAPVGSSASRLGQRLAWQGGVIDRFTPPLGVAMTNGLVLTVGK